MTDGGPASVSKGNNVNIQRIRLTIVSLLIAAAWALTVKVVYRLGFEKGSDEMGYYPGFELQQGKRKAKK